MTNRQEKTTDTDKVQNMNPAEKPESDIYTPIPVESFSFPVGIGLLDLSKRYMQMIHWHWHDEVEFILIRQGEAKLKLSNEAVILSAGEGAFINQGQLHSIRTYGEDDCALYSLKFHPAFLFGYGQTTLSTKYLTPVLSSPTLCCLPLKKENSSTCQMLSLIEKAYDCCEQKPFGYELSVKSYLCQIWNLLLPFARTSEATSRSHASLDSARIKQALLFIEKKHMEPLTLDEIADSIHVSRSECCRCFQRSVGVTPFEYLMKFRIFESTRKIMRGDEAAKSISTLAASVGFNNTSYYNKLFKKYLNCTPSEYKKHIQTASYLA